MMGKDKPFSFVDDDEPLEDGPDLSVSGPIDPKEFKKELGGKEKDAKVRFLKIVDLMVAIEMYNFECEAGPLTNCHEWKELKKEVEKIKPEK